jgi:hypothetical protein
VPRRSSEGAKAGKAHQPSPRFGLTTPSQMYVSEIFKVVGGRVVRIDNIGVMMQGVATLGFVH